MSKYRVNVREVHVAMVDVEADSPEEAIKKVHKEGYAVERREYGHTMSPYHWSVEDEDGVVVLW